MSQLLDQEWQRSIASSVDHWAMCAKESIASAAYESMRPSVLYRPNLSIDGNQWCALYGANLQDGVAGFGDSPAAAMDDFDRAWNDKTLVVKSDVFADMGFAAPTFPGVNKEGQSHD